MLTSPSGSVSLSVSPFSPGRFCFLDCFQRPMGVTEARVWSRRGLGLDWSSSLSNVPGWSPRATGLTTSPPA